MSEKMRVWWNPQIGKVEKPFYVSVETVEEAKKVMDILSAYDGYQLQNRLKPDYANMGGLQVYDEECEEWLDWFYEDEDDYFEDVDDYIENSDNAEKIEAFNEELFSQLDWNILDNIYN